MIETLLSCSARAMRLSLASAVPIAALLAAACGQDNSNNDGAMAGSSGSNAGATAGSSGSNGSINPSNDSGSSGAQSSVSRSIECGDYPEPELIASFDYFPNVGLGATSNFMLSHEGYLYLATTVNTFGTAGGLVRVNLETPGEPEVLSEESAASVTQLGGAVMLPKVRHHVHQLLRE